jgi:hypothetical protein
MSSFDDQDDLEALRRLQRDEEPPAELEERVVAALRRQGLVAPATGRPAAAGRRWLVAAVVALAAAGGWIARGLVPSAPPVAPPAEEYLVLLSEPRGLDTTKSTAELVDEYRRWAAGLGAAGRLVAGRRLLDGGRHLTGSAPSEPSVADEVPPIEATGFFLIRAAGWDEALSLLADCPHLAYGGEISLRRVARDG